MTRGLKKTLSGKERSEKEKGASSQKKKVSPASSKTRLLTAEGWKRLMMKKYRQS